jgi:DNA-binding PadR family transcriptional regulator
MARNEENANMIRGNTELLVLSVLRDGPAHGYSIVGEIESRTGGALSLKQGSIYPLLYSMEEQGFVTSDWNTPNRGERARRIYSITATGQSELERRLESFVRFSNAVLKTAGFAVDKKPLLE